MLYILIIKGKQTSNQIRNIFQTFFFRLTFFETKLGSFLKTFGLILDFTIKMAHICPLCLWAKNNQETNKNVGFGKICACLALLLYKAVSIKN